MKNIIGYVVSASESSADLGTVDLTKALQAFEKFPWTEERAKGEQTGVLPTLSFGAPDERNSYINITPNEDGTFMTDTEAILRPGLLGFLFRKVACRETDDATVSQVREQLQQFFELECRELFDKIEEENRSRG